MATWSKTTRLVNPARKRKARRSNLSPKQIKFFGTPAQKAALKRKRRAAALTSLKKRAKNSARPKRTAHRRRNAPIITAGLVNPAATPKRSTPMSKTKKRKSRKNRASSSTPRVVHHYHRPRKRKRNSNSFMSAPRRRRSTGRRRKANPSLRGGTGIVTKGLWAMGGLILSRLVPQFFLGAKNTGVVGYGSNLAVAIGGGYLAKSITKSSDAGNMFVIGGIGGLVLRAVQDFTPFGQAVNSSLQGLGDIGVYGATTFFVPLAEAPGSDRGAVDLPAAVMRPAAAAAPAGMGVVPRYTRGAGRYN